MLSGNNAEFLAGCGFQGILLRRNFFKVFSFSRIITELKQLAADSRRFAEFYRIFGESVSVKSVQQLFVVFANRMPDNVISVLSFCSIDQQIQANFSCCSE